MVQYPQVAPRVLVLLVPRRVYRLPILFIVVVRPINLTVIQQVNVVWNCVQGALQLVGDMLRIVIHLLRELSLVIDVFICRPAHSLHLHHTVSVRLIRLSESKWKVAWWSVWHDSLHGGRRAVLHELIIRLDTICIV